MFCQGFMIVSPLMLALIALPIGDWNVNGQKLTYVEIWTSGYAPALAIACFLMTVGAWGAAARNRRSRWAIVLSGLVPYLVLFFGTLTGYDWFAVLGGAVMSFLLFLVLFRLPSIAAYYAQDHEGVESA
jgi:hypothetical protein